MTKTIGPTKVEECQKIRIRSRLSCKSNCLKRQRMVKKYLCQK